MLNKSLIRKSASEFYNLPRQDDDDGDLEGKSKQKQKHKKWKFEEKKTQKIKITVWKNGTVFHGENDYSAFQTLWRKEMFQSSFSDH